MQTFFNCYTILNVIEFHMPVKEKKIPLMMLNQRDPMAELTVKHLVSVLELQHQYVHHKP